jgi:hypothetical protein
MSAWAVVVAAGFGPVPVTTGGTVGAAGAAAVARVLVVTGAAAADAWEDAQAWYTKYAAAPIKPNVITLLVVSLCWAIACFYLFDPIDDTSHSTATAPTPIPQIGIETPNKLTDDVKRLDISLVEVVGDVEAAGAGIGAGAWLAIRGGGGATTAVLPPPVGTITPAGVDVIGVAPKVTVAGKAGGTGIPALEPGEFPPGKTPAAEPPGPVCK